MKQSKKHRWNKLHSSSTFQKIYIVPDRSKMVQVGIKLKWRTLTKIGIRKKVFKWVFQLHMYCKKREPKRNDVYMYIYVP